MHLVESPDCSMLANDEFKDFKDFLHYKVVVKNIEEQMRNTIEIWPKTYPNIHDMIEAGFYYIGESDTVSCIFCGVTLDSWTPEDSPIEEHKKANPICKFVMYL